MNKYLAKNTTNINNNDILCTLHLAQNNYCVFHEGIKKHIGDTVQTF